MHNSRMKQRNSERRNEQRYVQLLCDDYTWYLIPIDPKTRDMHSNVATIKEMFALKLHRASQLRRRERRLLQCVRVCTNGCWRKGQVVKENFS